MIKKLIAILPSLLIFYTYASAKDLTDDEKKRANQHAKVAQKIAVASVIHENINKEDKQPANLPILSVTISGLENEEYLKNAKAFLDIYKDNGKSIKNESYTRYLTNVGVEQIQQSLQPFGYYSAKIDSTINESKNQWLVNYNITLGKPVRVNSSEILITPDKLQKSEFTILKEAFPLKKGDILQQEKYSDFKNKMLAIATTDGYFDGHFTRKQIMLSDSLLTADIYLTYDTGHRYTFGDVTIEQDFLDQDFVNRYKTFHSGQVYSSTDIATLQRDLYNSGYAKVIDVEAAPNKKTKQVPVTLKVTPKKNKKHTFGFGYGTDNGLRGLYNFDWRWVNRKGHKFKSEIFASEKQFKTGVEYTIPGDRPAYDTYQVFANFDRLWGDNSKESTTWNLGASYKDANGNLSREFGIKWQQEHFSIGNDNGNVGLLTPYARLTYRKVDDPLHIKDGLYIDGYFTAASDSLLSNISLFQAKGDAKYIKTFSDVNRIKLAAGTGRIWTEDFHRLPVAYRFFTGGDKTIRGYKYESIGDTDSSGTVVGGNKMYYMSAEYEYFFKENMAAAAFVDAGDAYSNESAKLKIGAGLGFHYYSPIGPIKVDVAHGFDEPGDTFRFHLSIGPEF
ncbi:MAG: outer membrane protein assembly factor [Gammaproteobacteria bacterium]|nr:outer membrane protein assembly factor [Gammaproteobacteria bacterium]